MANTKFQVRRTSVSGRTPNTTASYATNSQYIAAGEFALNMTDRILYTSDGTNLLTIGANNVDVNISNTLTVKSISANGSLGSAGYGLFSNGSAIYWASPGASSVDQNAQYNWTNTHTFNANVTYETSAVIIANGSFGTANQVLTSNGTGMYWATSTGEAGTPGGSNTQIQFNDSGSFGGNANATFDKTTSTLVVANQISAGNLSANSTDITPTGIIFYDTSVLNNFGQIVALYNNLAMA